jgi:hypothetical protein
MIGLGLRSREAIRLRRIQSARADAETENPRQRRSFRKVRGGVDGAFGWQYNRRRGESGLNLLFAHYTQTPMLFVPYRNPTDALTDTVGGRIQLAYSSAALAMPFVHAGKARVLAIGSA